jgi:hypothetical protein
LTLQGDARGAFVGRQDPRPWNWGAIDARRAAIVGVDGGARDRGGAKGLWRSLPAVYRQGAVAYPECWSSYAASVPAALEPSARRPAAPPRSSASTTPGAKGSRAWSARPGRVPSSGSTMSVPSGGSCTTTTLRWAWNTHRHDFPWTTRFPNTLMLFTCNFKVGNRNSPLGPLRRVFQQPASTTTRLYLIELISIYLQMPENSYEALMTP